MDIESVGDALDLGLGEFLHVVGYVGRLLALDVGLGEDDVDLFESAAGGFGVCWDAKKMEGEKRV